MKNPFMDENVFWIIQKKDGGNISNKSQANNFTVSL